MFDRVPTLATEIRTHALKDLTVFFRKKITRSVMSKRALPRIPMNCLLETDLGTPVRVLDYNYQYMLIAGDVPAGEFHVRVGEIMLLVKRSPVEARKEAALFEVQNWEEISSRGGLRAALIRVLQGEGGNGQRLQEA